MPQAGASSPSITALDSAEIEQRMHHLGFPELEACWRDFAASRTALASIDESNIERKRNAHLEPLFGRPALVSAAALGGAVGTRALMGNAVDDLSRPLPHIAKPAAEGGYIANLTLLFVAGTMAAQRYLIHPFRRIMGQQAASMLRWDNFREHFEQGQRSIAAREKLAELGISGAWDNPAYAKAYKMSEGSAAAVDLLSVEETILASLRSLIGYKDPETRKHVPGRFTPALIEGKRSVTHIINTYPEEISLAKDQALPRTRASVWFQEIAAKYCKPDSEAARFLGTQAKMLEDGHMIVPEQAVHAAIWARNPWSDLTSQREFFSSASLRGKSLFESGSKGRLGTFGYLLNPAISCLDFSTRKGRLVRARMVAAVTPGESGDLPVLFVDGVEGTNSISPAIIRKAIEDYAAACGFRAVLYNTAVHNSTPKHFVSSVAKTGAPLREVKIEAVDSSTREYLDAFGYPIQPMEYQYPRGKVSSHVVLLDGSAPAIGGAVSSSGAVARFLQRNLLYILYADAMAFATLASAQVSSVLAGAMAVAGAAGLGLNHWYQQRSSRAAKPHDTDAINASSRA